MGLLSDLRNLVSGDAADKELERMELEQVRKMAEASERGEASAAGSALGPKVRRRYRFAGSVQGVGFRWTTTNLANSVGATGWVMNVPDGTVTAEIQGIREQVDAVIEGLDRYYNGRRWMAGFRIEEARDVEVISGELDFKPIY